MRFLIIDDDAVFASTLARTLQRWGHHSVVAFDADSACEAAQQQCFEVAILDLRLGEHNGLVLIEPLMDYCPQMKILVLTGYASIATAVDAVKRGAYNYLPKPATARMILAALESATLMNDMPDSLDPVSLKRLEWEHIQRVLEENNHNISATARALGMHRRTLQRKLAKKPAR